MELEELKNIWQMEDKHLDSRIKLNEKQLMKMNMDDATGEIDKIMNTALLGRNMALIYCFIAIGMAVFMIEEIGYSIPAILGGLAMLWSFISHLSIEKLNYKDSVVQLQKSVCAFRIHMASNAKYDILIVGFWFLTITPVFLKVSYDISLYSNYKAQIIFCLVGGIVLTLMGALSRKLYIKYDGILRKSEAYLAELIELEKNSLD